MERRGREYHGSNSLLLLLLLFLCSFFFPHPRQLVSQHFTLQSFTRLKTGLLPLHNRCSTFLYPTGEIQEETCEKVEITIYPFLLENISPIVRFSLRYFLLLRFPPLFHCLTIDGDELLWMKEGWKERKNEKKKKIVFSRRNGDDETERAKYVYIVLGSHFAGLFVWSFVFSFTRAQETTILEKLGSFLS